MTDRQGFQELMTEVSLGRVGLVMGLEVSRLARNNADWARLLEICAITDTLILDEEGVYDPTDFNDRLLLNMKGTFSEVELHVLRSRLRGGVLSKARRGELKTSGRAQVIVKNPRYAGAYYYGRQRSRKNVDGSKNSFPGSP